ncbi:hypothetical protein EVAR_74210_1 [Eumeta japonica]|uniref:Uncharacterized protein n=1 Tax=Eumeta variegata TaxID=151549 RepID=A0A4C1SFB0_EUMVA|nr:hypothetical protein EVAR_74210_1 [Eumeta japonica]
MVKLCRHPPTAGAGGHFRPTADGTALFRNRTNKCSEKADNAQVTPLGLEASAGGGGHLLPNGSRAGLPLINPIKKN